MCIKREKEDIFIWKNRKGCYRQGVRNGKCRNMKNRAIFKEKGGTTQKRDKRGSRVRCTRIARKNRRSSIARKAAEKRRISERTPSPPLR
jgi:hypothetical protein